jgi:two-component system cell cycle sensor histidine kinase/response regulator CckA
MNAPRPPMKTILLVDDDTPFRAIVSELLELAGYRVLGASNGLEALRLNRRFPGRIDIAIIDMVMPLMSGVALVDRLRRKRPVRFLLRSGDITALAADGAQWPQGAGFIQKPFTHRELLGMVRDLLSSGGGCSGRGPQ